MLQDETVAAPSSPAALRISGLRKVYPATRHSPERRALDGVTLSVEPGEWVALLGPNGSGKSTLVRIISGADGADAGEAEVLGVQIAGAAPEARRRAAARMGVVFQRPGLDELLSGRENLAAQASLFGLTGDEARGRIARVATELGVIERIGDRIGTLSGGLQRRVDLARALLHDPDLLILDEATTGLDHQARSGFLDAIERLRAGRDRPMTVLMTTHLMDEAERAGRVVMMAAGRVVADGPPRELRESCGGRLVRVQAGASQEGIDRALREAGFEVTSGEGGALVGRAKQQIDEAALERTVVRLTRMGAAFEVAPPNLGDAYLALTGAGLESDVPEEPARRRRRRR